MSPRFVIAWAMFALTLLLAAGGLILLMLDLGTPVPESPIGIRGEASFIALTVMGLSFTSVGLLIALRHPENSVGWLFLVIGSLAEAQMAAFHYAVFGLLARPGALPVPEIAGWIFVWSGFVGGIITGIFVTLYFPTGRLPSPRWGPVAVLGALAALAGWLTVGFYPGPALNATFVTNPFGIGAPFDVFATLGAFTFGAVAVAFLLAVASLVARYTRASMEERQQIKWYAYAAGLHGLGFVAYIVSFRGPELVAFELVIATGIPIAAGIAILRYRLYDIDLLISRTVVYGGLSGILAATYFAAVVSLQAILRPLTSGSELAVAGSTLLVVALFQPLRRRVQDAVDRRFYRARYDAARTLDAFTARLRDEVDLGAVRADLLDVIGETMRPSHASVWLRDARR